MGTFSDIREYLRIYRTYLGRRLYIIFALTIGAALAEGLGITLLLPLLRASDTVGGETPTGGIEGVIYSLLDSIGVANSMVSILVFIGIMFAAKAMLLFAKNGYQGYLQAELLRELKAGLYDRYSSMTYSFYASESTGHFINVINSQVGRFFTSFQSFANFLSQIITTISYFALAVVLTWRFALMAIAIGALILMFFRRLNIYVRQLSRDMSTEMSHLNKLLVQSLQAFKYITSTNQTAHLRSGVMQSIDRVTGYTFRQRLAEAFTMSVKEPTSIIFILAIIAFQVSVMNEPVAPIFVSILLFHRGMQALIGIQNGWQRVMNTIGSVEMVHGEFETIAENTEPEGEQKIGPLCETIEFDDVCFTYREEDSDVLKNITLRIPANTMVAFVGESGAGKSTLIDMLTLLLRPREGEIRIDGVRHDEIDLASWRSQIGYVSQETVVFDDTIANNISLWSHDDGSTDAIEEAARKAHAHHFIKELPDGYETVVGDRGVRLSGGQRQRLFIARELFKRPNLLILDEATSALDTESERHIQESIDGLKGQMTVVIIAHRLSTIKNVDRVYVMDHGRIVERGSYDHLRNSDASQFRSMVEMQQV